MVSRTQLVVCRMLPVLFFILGTPAIIQADTPEAPVRLNPGVSDMVKIPAGRFRVGLTFNQTNHILEICTKVDKACTR